MRLISSLTMLLFLSLVLGGCSDFRLKKSVSTVRLSCQEECAGKCEFEIGLVGIHNKKLCDGKGGYVSATLQLRQTSTNKDCIADFEREPDADAGKGLLTWKLCTGTECKLSEKNFAPTSPFPLGPDDEIPEGKEALSRECYESIRVQFMTDRTGAYYHFLGPLSSVASDFDILARCRCKDSTAGGQEIEIGVDFELD